MGELIVEDMIVIFCGFKGWYEVYYGVMIFDSVLVVVVVLFNCYLFVC